MNWVQVAAWTGFAGVALGAFGAHAWKERLAAGGRPEVYETGSRYHLVHALAILGVGILGRQGALARIPAWVPWCFLAGILVFSGSLYALALSGQRRWGAVTPLGGLLLLVGWLGLALG